MWRRAVLFLGGSSGRLALIVIGRDLRRVRFYSAEGSREMVFGLYRRRRMVVVVPAGSPRYVLFLFPARCRWNVRFSLAGRVRRTLRLVEGKLCSGGVDSNRPGLSWVWKWLSRHLRLSCGNSSRQWRQP